MSPPLAANWTGVKLQALKKPLQAANAVQLRLNGIFLLSKSAVAQARQRLGAEPLRALFEISAKAWSDTAKDIAACYTRPHRRRR
jgi:hypothetical protein